MQQQVRASGLRGGARQRGKVGVVANDGAQRLVGHGQLGVGPLFHQRHDLSSDRRES